MPDRREPPFSDVPPPVDFHRHAIDEQDIAAAVDVLRSLFLTTGPVTGLVETKLAGYLGRRHVVAMNNCTTALMLSLKALDIGVGDEVITSPMTFAASITAIMHAGATPVLVDVDPATALIDPEAVEAHITPRTRAVLPVHLYGQMADMRRLVEICRPRDIAIVEDAAHAVESSRDDTGPGQLGDLACLSFYATKNLTCGEGGAVVTDNDALAQRLRRLRLHGMSKTASDRHGRKYEHWDITELGYKANLPDILAALLLHQIDRLEDLRVRREQIARRYEAAFAALEEVDFPRVLPACRSARHLFTIWVPEARRDQTLLDLGSRGIGVAVNYRAVHLLSYFRQQLGYEPGNFPHAERIGRRTITLPCYPGLRAEEQQRVIDAVREVQAGWS